MKTSVIIPCRNESESLPETVRSLDAALSGAGCDFEILLVDDGSEDNTWSVIQDLARIHAHVRPVRNEGIHGFGMAIRRGLEEARGDILAPFMADLSDSPQDLLQYVEIIKQGHDCAFGSRFISGGGAVDYPWHKLVLNRLANTFIRLLFGLHYNDTTNAFKAYRREVIEGISPVLSRHYNLTVEMPLKAIVRGYSHAVIPISWHHRKRGISKLKIQEMGSRYLFIVLHVWLEKMLSRGDYRRKPID